MQCSSAPSSSSFYFIISCLLEPLEDTDKVLFVLASQHSAGNFLLLIERQKLGYTTDNGSIDCHCTTAWLPGCFPSSTLGKGLLESSYGWQLTPSIFLTHSEPTGRLPEYEVVRGFDSIAENCSTFSQGASLHWSSFDIYQLRAALAFWLSEMC